MNPKKEYSTLFKRIEKFALLIDNIFAQANKEAAKIVLSTNYDSSGTVTFNFSDYPETTAALRELKKSVSSNVRKIIVNGIRASWDYSNGNLDKLVKDVLGRVAQDNKFRHYFDNNDKALEAFIKRKRKGLNLSNRVWNITEDYISNLEDAVSVSLERGMSAAELSRSVRDYLVNPDKLFRRVRDNDKFRLSKRAKAYHPGAGVYRSSYKNAMRLARSEINMSYRYAEYTRYQQLDFIVGFEVKRSGRVFDCSVCEALAGKYPKDFKFTGWHPQCRCYVVPILKTDDEIQKDNERIMQGKKVTSSSINRVKVVNYSFTEWLKTNAERIKKNKSKPYFIRDNKKYVNV